MSAYKPDLSLPTFYLGTHRPNWLWDGSMPFPLMASDRTLREVVNLRPATAPEWSLDSGGFTELSSYGRWTVSPREYVERVARYDREIGGLAWAAPQDWMCEPAIISGGRVSATVTAPGTGLSVAGHQQRTVANYLELTALWGQYSDTESPFIPVLQGYKAADYEACHALYGAAGVDLGAVPLVGVGSVCRRQAETEIRDIVSVVAAMPLVSHWFGMKLTGIRLAGVRTGEIWENGELTENGPASLDSLAWSYEARRSARLSACTHRAQKCSGCRVWATAWRDKAIKALRDAATAPVQDMLPFAA
jgi:hypothetical protein